MEELKERWAKKDLSASKPGVIAAGGISKIIVEDPSLPVSESNFDIRRSPLDGGILFLDDQAGTPFRISGMKYPIAYF
jgi:hypothetical protein